VAQAVSHDIVAKSIDLSGADRHEFAVTLRAKGPCLQRVRAYGELSSGDALPGRADPDPSGSSRITAPCGLVDAEKSLAESSGAFFSLQVPGRVGSHFTHIDDTLRITHVSIRPCVEQLHYNTIIANVF
jgi:hypothetical protein